MSNGEYQSCLRQYLRNSGHAVYTYMFAWVPNVLIVHTRGNKPRRVKAKAGCSFTKSPWKQAIECTLDERRSHLFWQEIRGRKSVPFLSKTHNGLSVDELRSLQWLVYRKRRSISAHNAHSPQNTSCDSKKYTSKSEEHLDLHRYSTIDEDLVWASEIVKYHMHRDCSVEAEKRVRRIHEPLLFVSLDSENSKPQVEGSGVDHASPNGCFHDRMLLDDE